MRPPKGASLPSITDPKRRGSDLFWIAVKWRGTGRIEGGDRYSVAAAMQHLRDIRKDAFGTPSLRDQQFDDEK